MLHFALALATSLAMVPDLESLQEVSSAVPGASLIAYGDLNGDGFMDIACASSELRSIVWFAGSASGPSGC